MTDRDFIFWLKGFLDVKGLRSLGKEELSLIGQHLDNLINPPFVYDPVRESMGDLDITLLTGVGHVPVEVSHSG